jgi:hypothetical protein
LKKNLSFPFMQFSRRVPVKFETKWNSSKRNEFYRNEIETKRNKSKRNCFVSFRFRFGKFCFVSVNFISFRFAFYRYPNKDVVFQWCLLDSKSNWHNFHIFSSFYFIFSLRKNWITNQLQRELPFNLKKGGACHFFYKIFWFEAWKKKGFNQK